MGAVETPVWSSEKDWQEWVDQYAADLQTLVDMGLGVVARRRLADLADPHNLLPSQMAMFLLNSYLESDEAGRQAGEMLAVGGCLRDQEHRLEEALSGA